MRTSGDITVRSTASMRAIALTAVLTGSALIGTAAWAHADETGRPDRSTTGVALDTAPASHGLTELARPRFSQPLPTR
jgi:hypothetical protein